MNSKRSAVGGGGAGVGGYKARGLRACPGDGRDRARHTLHRIAREEYAVVYLTEQLAAQMEADIARYKDELTPAIILIPGKEGSLSMGMANIKKSVERAVGADIL